MHLEPPNPEYRIDPDLSRILRVPVVVTPLASKAGLVSISPTRLLWDSGLTPTRTAAFPPLQTTPIYQSMWIRHTLNEAMRTLLDGQDRTRERMQQVFSRMSETRRERAVREAGEEGVRIVRHGLRHITAALDDWDGS